MGPGSLGGCSTSANGGDELSPTSSRVDRNSLPKKRIQGRQNEQREQGRAYQAPNYHGRERLLNFGAGAGRDRLRARIQVMLQAPSSLPDVGG